ncbi:uncharacterized protein LOC133393132 [Anopheles gambiae]|uniref:uncharacterized protein LOC133393132 n=1 Tax=Anopheles gambiae TaxID=7165 RepID=UPI002AC9EDE2|nr:uncharacterized protein LOC133393132 [Anopheles gambiae]
MELPKQTVDGAALKRKYRHLKGIHLASYRDGLPKIIIGLPHAHLMCALRTKLGRAGGPIAMQTHLGWVLLGASSSKSKQERLFSLMENGKEEKTMADLMKGYFSTEEFGVKLVTNLPQSKEEERAKILMKETLNKTKNGYEIGLLWKRDEIRLPESFAQALRRLQCLERKMERDAILKKWYHEEIAAYCQKGYAQAIEGNNLLKDEHNPKLNYIPHFAIINYNKPKPKPRLVFDAAAKNNGISLNSQLLSGPDAVASLFGILIRFREGRVGISGDIKEMFHQVGIRQEDRCAQRFLYRSNPNDKPQIFEMKVMTFGATCSPACAQFVKNENAALFQTRYPEAAIAIVRNHYVDDYLDSFDSDELAIKRTKEVINIHDEAKFYIRNFLSNSVKVLESLPKERVSDSNLMKICESDNTYDKILGQWWDRERDSLKYIIKGLIETGGNATKRILLSNTMKIYDPLGLIANYVVESKILMQDIWRQGLDWDDKLPAELQRRWQEWVVRMKEVETINIPRCYSSVSEVLRRELHVFVDASEKAFAAVACKQQF